MKILRENFDPVISGGLPLTYCSAVVIEELLAGVRTIRHRRQAAALYEPFERVRRIITPSQRIWKETGTIAATIADQAPQLRDKLSREFLNDILIALSGRSIGATVVTRNEGDFRLIRQFRKFSLEVI